MKHARQLKLSLGTAAALLACQAGAIELGSGDPDWALRLDTTLKASTIYRTGQDRKSVV
jgi:hypothetical protein